MSAKPKAPRRPGIHKSPLPVHPNKPKMKVVPTLLQQPYSVVDNVIEYLPIHMDYAILPSEQVVVDPPKPVAFVASDELAFKIAKFLSAEHLKENPACGGCSAFGPPVWEGDIGDNGEGWYHFTAQIHPFKEKYIWCARMNKPQEIPEEDLQTHHGLDDEVLDNQEGTLPQLAQFIGRHFAALHEFPIGSAERKKFIEEVREIQEDIRGWTLPALDLNQQQVADAAKVRAHAKFVSQWSVAKTELETVARIIEGFEPSYPLPDQEKVDLKQRPISMDKDQVEFQLKCVAGRILTLVDAMVSNEAQNKAFKTYVKKEFREQFNRVFKAFFPSAQGCETNDPEELAVADAAFN
jgi:hypothetical protein